MATKKQLARRRAAYARKKKAKKEAKKFWGNVSGSILFGASMIFGWMILGGLIKILPNIAGGTLIVIGIVGLSVLGYFGFKR